MDPYQLNLNLEIIKLKLLLIRLRYRIINKIKTKIIIVIFYISILLKSKFTNFYYELKKIKFLKNIIAKLVYINTLHIDFDELENNYRNFSIKSKKKITHIDITSLTNGTPRTGIQRVVFQIAKRFYLNKKNIIFFKLEPRLTPYFVEIDSNKFFKNNIISIKRLYFPDPKNVIFFLDFNLISHIIYKKILIYLKEKKEIKFYTMVYDILPFTNPAWFDVKDYKKLFSKWINTINAYGKILTISKTVKVNVLKNFNIKKNKIYPIRLGGDFKKIRLKNINKKFDLSFLMVGTIEPRKGYEDILNSLERIIKNNIRLRLIICGRLGWKYNKFIKKINYYKKNKINISFVNSPNDKQLLKIYSESNVLIAASYNEGFGIPILEALKNNLLVIARDIPIFKEVGGNDCYYFANNKGKNLEKFFINWIKKYQTKSLILKRLNKKITTWNETYKDIHMIINKD